MDQLDALVKQKGSSGQPVEQERIFEQYAAFLVAFSAKSPLILFVDDLHWADSASLGLLFQLGRLVGAGRILILGTYRPADVALGRGGARHPLAPVVTELTRYQGDISVNLDDIPEIASRQFVDDLLDAEPNRLGPDFRTALFHHTGGHALFTIELLRALQERGDLVRDGDERWVEGPSLRWDALPARVEGVIAERIDRLGDQLRQLLTVGSVQGEQFGAEVVTRVEDLSERQVIRQLSDELQRQHRLVRALGMVQVGGVRLSRYGFQHNLFQRYLYDGLDEIERVHLHRDVGEALEALLAGQTDEVADQLARHFEAAGVAGKAAAYRLQAGRRAHRLSGYQEATDHLSRGLALLAQVPPGPDRLPLELGLQLELGLTLIATEGYGSSQVEQHLARARDLCRALGDPAPLNSVLFGLCMLDLVRGQLAQASEEVGGLLLAAGQAGDDGYVIGCHVMLGIAALHLGRLEEARAHLEQAVAEYDPVRHHDLAYEQGQDPGVMALAYLCCVLWFLGYPEQALAYRARALQLAGELNDPYNLSVATHNAAVLYELLRQWPECQAQVEAAQLLPGQENFALYRSSRDMLHGVAIAFQGHIAEGIEELKRGLAGFVATGSQLSLPRNYTLMAEAYLLVGRQADGLRALAASFERGEQAWYLPEQYRLRGELLLLSPGNEVEAEAMFRQAIEVARGQQSRSFELRATMSLTRLLQGQDRAAEGKELLARCYGWFTEGFDTPDLADARDLLQQLP